MSDTTPPAQDVSGQLWGQPAPHLFLITANDAKDIQYVTRAIRIGSAGDLAVETEGGQTVTIPSCLAGETLAIRVTRVYATNTTAGDLMGYA